MKATIIGDGGWGTALAMILNRNGHQTTIWGPFSEYLEEIKKFRENITYLPGINIPDSIQWTAERKTAAENSDMVVIVVPSRFYKSVVESFKPFISSNPLIVSATKGLDEKTHQRMSVTAEKILGREVAVLSGPSHAEEVARQIPCAVAVAARSRTAAEQLQQWFSNDTFRVYTLDDMIGVELGGALKNVIAVAAGISDGMGFGDNTKAALMTRGMAEIMRLGVLLGAKSETFMGLSGIGDLMVTCMSRHSRNRGVGERLGKGEKLEEIMNSMKMVAEGIWNCRAAKELAAGAGVAVPVTEEVYAVVYEKKNPRRAMTDLMSRVPKSEQQ